MGHLWRRGVYGDPDCRGVAVCLVSHVAAGAHPVVCHRRFSLFCFAYLANSPPYLCAMGAFSAGVLAQHGDRFFVLDRQHVDWDFLGRMAAEGQTMKGNGLGDLNCQNRRDCQRIQNEELGPNDFSFWIVWQFWQCWQRSVSSWESMKKFIQFICVLLLPLMAVAHVNSPDVYFDGYA